MSRNDKVCMTLSFTKSASDSCQTKAREFWKFLDSQAELQPEGPTPHNVEPPPPSAEQSSINEGQQDTVWHDCLHVFQKFGLDKTALAAGKTCKLCNTQRRIEETADFADTITQPYDELNAELKAYEERLERLVEKQTSKEIENHATPKSSN